jgi:nitrate/nitrite transporter NarK
MKLTGRISGWFFGAAALGGMTIPFLVGQLFNTTGPKSTMVFLFFVLLVALMVFAGIEFARQARSSEVTT